MGMTSGGSYGMPWLIGEQAAASDGASDRARGLLLRRGANPCGRDGSGGEDGEQQAGSGAAERSMPREGRSLCNRCHSKVLVVFIGSRSVNW